MGIGRLLRLTIVVVAMTLFASGARADPAPVNSGFFRFGVTGSPQFVFEGDDFAISGWSDPFGGMGLRQCAPCAPADLLEFRIVTAGDFTDAAGRIGSVSYERLFLEGILRFETQ